MLFVDVERGRAEGIALAKELEMLSKAQEEQDAILSEDLIDDIEEHEQYLQYGSA